MMYPIDVAENLKPCWQKVPATAKEVATLGEVCLRFQCWIISRIHIMNEDCPEAVLHRPE